MNKAGKVIVSLVSVLLVVGLVVAVVVVVVAKKHDASGSKPVTAGSNLVDTVCANTEYKASCFKALSPLLSNPDPDYKDFINAALDATAAQLSSSLNLSESLLVKANANNNTDPRLKMSLEDCRDLLSLAASNLQTTSSKVANTTSQTLHHNSAELKSWLSSLITYSETCLDGVEDHPDFHAQLKDDLRNSSALTDNALAVISTVSSILHDYGLKLNPKAIGSSRRLLEFPTWFSASDRRLMAAVEEGGVKPDAVVAKDGSGGFSSISAAIDAYPAGGASSERRYIIYVKAGLYDEYITIDKTKSNIFMFGDGPRETIVTGNKSFASGFSTFRTASFSVIGQGFICKGMGFQNTAGPEGHQAVALRVQSEMSVFHNCRIDGHQDSLYVQVGRQFYRNCVISGTIDFIFGDATAVIQNSLIIARRPMDNQINAVTAQGRSKAHQDTGIVIHNCRIVPEEKLEPVRFAIKTYLGRPWKEYSRTVIMESTLNDFIHPAGWFPWAGSFALDTLYYAEYANRGAGAATEQRVKWNGYHVISKTEALQFSAGTFLGANSWLPATGAPFEPNLLA